MPKTKPAVRAQLNIRCTPADVALVNRLAAALSEGGVQHSQSDVVRLTLREFAKKYFGKNSKDH